MKRVKQVIFFKYQFIKVIFWRNITKTVRTAELMFDICYNLLFKISVTIIWNAIFAAIINFNKIIENDMVVHILDKDIIMI